MEIQQLLNNPIFGGAAALSLAGGLIYTLKGLPAKIWGRIQRQYIHTVRVYDYDELFHILERWLYKNHSTSYKEVEARLDEQSQSSAIDGTNKRKKALIKLKQEPNVFWVKVDGHYLLFSSIKEKIEHADSSIKRFSSSYSIRGLKARNNIKTFLERIADEYYASMASNQISIFYNSAYGDWYRASPIKIKPLDRIILSPGLKDEIINDLKQFRNSMEWYYDVCIPYKRQYIFHGAPGTGKTSLSLAIGAFLNADIYVMNIKSFSNDTHMQTAFNNIVPGSVLLIEDIDASFNKRESANKDVSFSGLLNCMDGAFYKEGLITCITTNHLEKLDPALTRAGRTDKVIEIGHPKDQQISEFMSLFYGTEWIFSSRDSCKVSMSTIQEACLTNRNSPDAAEVHIWRSIHDKCAHSPANGAIPATEFQRDIQSAQF